MSSSKVQRDCFQLLCKIRAPDALVSLLCAQKIVAVVKPLVLFLQKIDNDLQTVNKQIKLTKRALFDLVNDHNQWTTIYLRNVKISTEIGSFLNRNSMRETYSTELKKVHFEEPIIRILADFDARMERNETVTSFLSCLLPENVENASKDRLSLIVEMYLSQLGFDSVETGVSVLEAEISTNKRLFKKNLKTSKMIEETECFPTIQRLLIIFILTPISNATSERAFSALRRIKTYLRNSMGQSRLNSAIIIASNNDLEVDTRKVFNSFVEMATRKANFICFDFE